jgi:hypothetical protein
MLAYRPHRVRVNASTYSTGEIHFADTIATLKTLEIVVVGSLVDGVTQENAAQTTRDPYSEADLPVYRARNRYSSALTRPLYAAYPPAVRPDEDPQGWTAALSDRGLLFGAARAETGRLSNASGILQYRRPSDAVAYDIASCVRSQSLINVAGLSLSANTTTGSTVALANVAVNDHVVVTPAGVVPAGVVIAYARVTAAGQVTVTFGNLTGAAISLTLDLQVVVFRRFF